jgi:hypothetical protein
MFSFLAVFLLAFTGFSTAVFPAQNHPSSQLRLSTFDMDVTPPAGHDLAYDPMIRSWDMGLRAKGVVLLGAGRCTCRYN